MQLEGTVCGGSSGVDDSLGNSLVVEGRDWVAREGGSGPIERERRAGVERTLLSVVEVLEQRRSSNTSLERIVGVLQRNPDRLHSSVSSISWEVVGEIEARAKECDVQRPWFQSRSSWGSPM